MSWPDTLENAANRLLDQIRDHADELWSAAVDLRSSEDATPSDLERADFHEAASAGARRYAETLQDRIEAGDVTTAVLERANLVATAAAYAGWLGDSGAVTARQEALDSLMADGVLAFYPQVPGRYVACYRLVAPC